MIKSLNLIKPSYLSIKTSFQMDASLLIIVVIFMVMKVAVVHFVLSY